MSAKFDQDTLRGKVWSVLCSQGYFHFTIYDLDLWLLTLKINTVNLLIMGNASVWNLLLNPKDIWSAVA